MKTKKEIIWTVGTRLKKNKGEALTLVGNSEGVYKFKTRKEASDCAKRCREEHNTDKNIPERIFVVVDCVAKN